MLLVGTTVYLLIVCPVVICHHAEMRLRACSQENCSTVHQDKGLEGSVVEQQSIAGRYVIILAPSYPLVTKIELSTLCSVQQKNLEIYQVIYFKVDIFLSSHYGNQKIRPATQAYFQLLRRASAEGFFCPLGKKRPYYAVLANFRPSVVSSSNRSNFQQ